MSALPGSWEVSEVTGTVLLVCLMSLPFPFLPRERLTPVHWEQQGKLGASFLHAEASTDNLQPGPAPWTGDRTQRSLKLGLMFCWHHFEIHNTFEKEDLHFHFTLGLKIT